VPLIRLIFSTVICLALLLTAHATHAEEQLALSTSLSAPELSDPLTLTTARNIRLDLVPMHNANAADLWARIRSGFVMRDLDSSLVTKHENWYSSRPEYLARMTDRGRRYLYYIVSEVERRGMPTEIALLPMIESAFNPGAYSTSKASGIWQFIPSTGKNFGMQQNWWYDGRRDVITATTGALDYLEKLHGMFGDWELALAAYNWGEGAVQRAQERNRKRGLPVNYTSLNMPDETRNYVPKLLAVKNIVANPAAFGLVLQDIPNEPYFAAISTSKHIDVKLAAQLAEVSLEEFAALNPAHNRPVILQENSDLILLPVDKVETFRSNLENYDKPLVSWQAYQPKKGETLSSLAPRFGMSVEKLRSVNGLSGNRNLSGSQTLLVPVNGQESEIEAEFETFNMHLNPITASQPHSIRYTVRKGDTLSSVARRYHVTTAQLRSWNQGVRKITAGQKLTIATSSKVGKYTGRSRKLAKSRGGKKLAKNRSSQKQAKRGGQKRVHVAYRK
jgi:membrane-bound lytic murein transglycosylase D